MPLVREDWTQLTAEEAQILLGLYHDDNLDSDLLGNMHRARNACERFLEDQVVRQRVQEGMSPVIHASANAFPNVAIEAIEKISNVEYFGIGIATRLLSLARPDRIVSLNGGSTKQLKEAFPEAGALSTQNRYGLLLEALYRKPWYDVDEPSDPFERRLWSMRAALLDCFVYIP